MLCFCLVLYSHVGKNNRFDFSNSYIWFEFYNTPLGKDVSLLCDVSSSFFKWWFTYFGRMVEYSSWSGVLQTIRAWHIVGRLGGCNSMNMQVILIHLPNQLIQSPRACCLSVWSVLLLDNSKHIFLSYWLIKKHSNIICAAITITSG